MSASQDAANWAETVAALGSKRGLHYDAVGGLNPKGGPAALCPGGSNRLTGELTEGFWGACCDGDEVEKGGFGRKAVLPRAVLAKAHMPDLATVVPVFDVESVTPGEEALAGHSRHRVEFESVEFNRRFIATVPKDHDPVALRELFSPSFLDWTTRIDRNVDFGITDQQLFFLWRLRELTGQELEAALDAAAGIFVRLRRDMEEKGIATYPPGPWHAGLEPFPSDGPS